MPIQIAKIVVILANPTFNNDKRANQVTKLCKLYADTCQKKGISVDFIDLYKDEEFNPIYSPEDKDTKALEYQIRIKNADQVAFFHPIWMGGVPAVLKGFLEKVFTKGFSYKIYKNIYEGLLKDKEALVVAVGEEPGWQFTMLYNNILEVFWKRLVVDRASFAKSNIVHFDNLRGVSEKRLEAWEKKIVKIANNLNTRDSVLDLL